MSLLEKYRPNSIEDIIDNKESILKIKERLDNNDKFILVCGPHGCGKTLSCELIFKDYDITYINPEDDDVLVKISKVSKSSFILIGMKLVIIIKSFENTIGNAELYKKFIKIADKSKVPIIGILRKSSKIYRNVIEFKIPDTFKITKFIENICEKENIVNENVLKLVTNCNNDIRKCILSLETNIDVKYDFFDDAFNTTVYLLKNKDKLSLSERFALCYSDKRNMFDTVFTNVYNSIDDIEDISNVMDSISYGDIALNVCNNKKEWLIDTYAINSNLIYPCSKMKYNKTFKRGKVLMNIHKFTSLGKIITDVKENKVYDIDKHYIIFMLHNLVIPYMDIIDNKEMFVKYLKNLGITFNVYVKYYNLINKVKLKKGDKDILENYWKDEILYEKGNTRKTRGGNNLPRE